ncbi:MAG: FKBP-type peptidyl-prolyl cis-trans isomerase [Kangiellaceae bacterium]
MNKQRLRKIALVAIFAGVLAGCQKADESKDKANESAVANTEVKEEDKVSYALGAKMANFIRVDIEKYKDLNMNKDAVSRGFLDGLSGTPLMTDDEIAAQFIEFQKKMQAAQKKEAEVAQAQIKADAEKNKVTGEAHLVANGKKEGVTTTKSGLQYKVITEGSGEKPKATDVVKVHYVGTLIDGNEFDSSVKRGEPATFPLNRVISGWTEGLQLMSVGSKYFFTIPYQLAYGEGGRPGSIPPASVLEFEVELLAINPEDKKEEKVKVDDK